MKNLKMFKAALAVTVLSLLAGCSDQISSSGEPYEQSIYKGGAAESNVQIVRQIFSTNILLLSKQVYTFNSENTGLSRFFSINAARLNLPESQDDNSNSCQDILVFNYETSRKFQISCNSDNLDLKSISILNTGSSPVKLDVVLSGKRAVNADTLGVN